MMGLVDFVHKSLVHWHFVWHGNAFVNVHDALNGIGNLTLNGVWYVFDYWVWHDFLHGNGDLFDHWHGNRLRYGNVNGVWMRHWHQHWMRNLHFHRALNCEWKFRWNFCV